MSSKNRGAPQEVPYCKGVMSQRRGSTKKNVQNVHVRSATVHRIVVITVSVPSGIIRLEICQPIK